ncbi:MAG: hypothetical protein ACFCU3_06300 [Verrucomicrobiales bacterium]
MSTEHRTHIPDYGTQGASSRRSGRRGKGGKGGKGARYRPRGRPTLSKRPATIIFLFLLGLVGAGFLTWFLWKLDQDRLQDIKVAEQEEIQRASPEANPALTRQPTAVIRAWEDLSRDLAEKSPEEQLESLLEFNAENPTFPGLVNPIGELIMEIRGSNAAAAYFNEQVLKDPTDPSTYIGMAQIGYREGNPEAAIRYLNQGLAFRPSDPKLLFLQAYTNRVLGNRRQALALFERFLLTGGILEPQALAEAFVFLIRMDLDDLSDEEISSSPAALQLMHQSAQALEQQDTLRAAEYLEELQLLMPAAQFAWIITDPTLADAAPLLRDPPKHWLHKSGW